MYSVKVLARWDRLKIGQRTIVRVKGAVDDQHAIPGPVSRKFRNFLGDNTLCVLKTKVFRVTNLCSYFNFYCLYRISGSEFNKWLFGLVKFSGLLRNARLTSSLFYNYKLISTLTTFLEANTSLQSTQPLLERSATMELPQKEPCCPVTKKTRKLWDIRYQVQGLNSAQPKTNRRDPDSQCISPSLWRW